MTGVSSLGGALLDLGSSFTLTKALSMGRYFGGEGWEIQETRRVRIA